jgi:hypothetical protein
MLRTVIYQIASAYIARENCRKSGNALWLERHEDKIERLVSDHLPHGSGFDSGTKFDWESSTPKRLVFQTSFHHMNENGFYDGWTKHQVSVTPGFCGLDLVIGGRDRNEIKDYIAEVFHSALSAEVDDSNPAPDRAADPGGDRRSRACAVRKAQTWENSMTYEQAKRQAIANADYFKRPYYVVSTSMGFAAERERPSTENIWRVVYVAQPATPASK